MPRRARRRAYTSDLADAQWAAIAPMIPDAAPGGRPRKANKREIVEAICGSAWNVDPLSGGSASKIDPLSPAP